jgi:integrase/recombinase XerD
MATVKAILKQEGRQDGYHLVMVRFIQNRKIAYVGTGVYIKPEHWNPKGSLDKCDWVKKDAMRETYNAAIESLIKEALSLALEHRAATAAQLKHLLQGEEEEKPDFIRFYALELERIKKDSTPRTHEKYTNIYDRLKAYAGTLPFDKLTVDWLKKYEAHLLTVNKRNTVSKHLAFVKTIIRRAVAEGVMPYADNPFLSFRLKSEKPQKDRLTKEELQRIQDLDLPEGQRVHHARTAFLLQFFLAGMRIGDLLQMRWEMIEGDRLEYKSQKTNTHLSVKLVPAALKLIEPYRKDKGFVLPFVPEGLKPDAQQKRVESMTALINKMLSEIAKKAGIEKKITTHVARHSFASLAWANSRDIKAVSQALGHTSVTMTETYLRELSGSEQDSLLDTAFEGF